MDTTWLTNVGKYIQQNSPTILSGVAVGGVITTAVLAVKATPKALVRIDNLEQDHDATKAEVVRATWKFYIPAGLAGAATIGCIIGANTIGSKRNAALLAAYSLVDQTFREYKDQVFKQLGEAKERKIHDAAVIERMEKNPPKDGQVLVFGGGDQLCFDTLTGRYWRSDIEQIRRAENEVNHRILADMYCSQNEFYELIGLEPVLVGDELGWNIDHRMELIFTSHLNPEGVPCLAVGYKQLPFREYGKIT